MKRKKEREKEERKNHFKFWGFFFFFFFSSGREEEEEEGSLKGPLLKAPTPLPRRDITSSFFSHTTHAHYHSNAAN